MNNVINFYKRNSLKYAQKLFQPLLRGEEVYTQMVFFVDRYIHRRVVSGIIRKLTQRRIGS